MREAVGGLYTAIEAFMMFTTILKRVLAVRLAGFVSGSRVEGAEADSWKAFFAC